jgi:hypothetical protein
MALQPLFSTYKQGENRVTASLLAVLERLGISLTERILAGLLEEPELSLVTFTALPTTPGVGNPDGEIKASFHYLFEVKTARGALSSAAAVDLKVAYKEKLSGDDRTGLIILTPDSGCPPPLAAVINEPQGHRISWVNFVKLTEVLKEILDDDDEAAGERERYLIRELIALFRVEGLLDDLDTVVVAARRAYPTYLKYGAYICQANRAFRPVTRMGFYTGKEVKSHVPRVLGRCQNVTLDADTVEAFRQSDDAVERAVAEIIDRNLADGFPLSAGARDVYWLSAPEDPETINLPAPIPYLASGAFTMGQRYVDSSKLRVATSCEELV